LFSAQSLRPLFAKVPKDMVPIQNFSSQQSEVEHSAIENTANDVDDVSMVTAKDTNLNREEADTGDNNGDAEDCITQKHFHQQQQQNHEEEFIIAEDAKGTNPGHTVDSVHRDFLPGVVVAGVDAEGKWADLENEDASFDTLLQRITHIVGNPMPKTVRELVESRTQDWADGGYMIDQEARTLGMPSSDISGSPYHSAKGKPNGGVASSVQLEHGNSKLNFTQPPLDSADEIIQEAMRLRERRQSVSHNAAEQRPLKSRRITWTKAERELLVRADEEYGRPLRLRVSDLLGIPQSTSDKVVARVRTRGSSDGLTDSRSVRENRMGRGAKFESKDAQWLLCQWLHEDGSLTLSTLLSRLNNELLRSIVVQSSHVESLQLKEREIDGPLDINKWLHEPEIRQKYNKVRLKSMQSVQNNLALLVFSHRPPLQSDIANSPVEVSLRRRVARLFQKGLLCEGTHIVFIDQLPFLQRLIEKDRIERGALPCEHRTAVLRQGRKITLCTQVAMAASPSYGIIDTQLFLPDIGTAMARHAAAIATADTDPYLRDTLSAPFALFARKRSGALHPAAALGWTLEPLAIFLDRVLRLLADRIEAHAYACPRRLLLVVNNSHADWADSTLIQSLIGYDHLFSVMARKQLDRNPSVHVLGLRPSAADLNFSTLFYPSLCEVANNRGRELQHKASLATLFQEETRMQDSSTPIPDHRLEKLLTSALGQETPDPTCVEDEVATYRKILESQF